MKECEWCSPALVDWFGGGALGGVFSGDVEGSAPVNNLKEEVGVCTPEYAILDGSGEPAPVNDLPGPDDPGVLGRMFTIRASAPEMLMEVPAEPRLCDSGEGGCSGKPADELDVGEMGDTSGPPRGPATVDTGETSAAPEPRRPVSMERALLGGFA